MSHVAALELRNWGPFRGEHRVELEPEVYAVIGKRDSDEESSNWVGKTAALAAIRFALFGDRPDNYRLEDDWITRGEPDGYVRLELSCGVLVKRSRRRGSATELRVEGGALPIDAYATGRHAADKLADYLAVTGRDFAAGPWVGQREVARLVLSTPGDRARLVEGWLALEPLRSAEAYCQDKVKEAEERRGDAHVAAQHAREQLARLPDAATLQADVDRKRAELAHAAGVVAGYDERVEAAVAAATLANRAAGVEQRRATLQAVVEQLERKLDVPAVGPDAALEKAAREANSAADAARNESVRVRALVHGEGFDGRCPVTCDACPVADDVRERGRELGAQAKAAAVEARQKREAAELAEGRLRNAREQAALRAEDELRLANAHEQLEALPAPVDETAAGEDVDQLRQDRAQWQRHGGDLHVEVRELERQANNRTAFEAELQARELEVGAHEAEARKWAEAAAVARGARREVAEEAVGGIELDANALLYQTGADLRVRFRWEREGQGLASSCHKCGAAYPSKQSVKRCDRCGADRGQKLVEALELVPSDRSGAADDLAGLFVQLGAAAWLREKRGSPLNLVVVDEPFAHLDPLNARKLGAQLHRGLTGRLRFSQAFVVAHTAAVTEAMPRRLVVLAGPGGSRLEVE